MRDDVPVIRPLLDDAGISALRTALAPFTTTGVEEALGLAGRAALDRADLAGAARTLRGRDDAVATFLRLFVLGREVDESAARSAFDPLPLDAVVAAGLVERSASSVRAALDVRPYSETGSADWWVVSDLGSDVRGGAPLRRDHVLGIGSASLTLAQCTPRAQVARALDIGTGCGIQALHLSQHAAHVTATDISVRALSMAATTAALSGVDWDLRRGSLLEPVTGDAFDLVVANPPFVISGGTEGYEYRDSGMAGDAVCADLVASMGSVLAPHGIASLLANWIVPLEGSWTERVAGWVEGTGCDAWVWQRELVEPGEYVAMWLRDSGARPGTTDWTRRYDEWADWLSGAGIAAIGMGLITLWNGGADNPVVVMEDVPQAVEQPAGAHVAPWIERNRVVRRLDDRALLDSSPVLADGVVLEQASLVEPGRSGGWAVATIRLRQSYAMRWAVESDAAVAALVAACDGHTPVRTAVAVLAASLGMPADDVGDALVPVLRDLIGRGFLEYPADGSDEAGVPS